MLLKFALSVVATIKALYKYTSFLSFPYSETNKGAYMNDSFVSTFSVGVLLETRSNMETSGQSTTKNSQNTTKRLYLILTFRPHHEIFIRRSWYSVLPSLDWFSRFCTAHNRQTLNFTMGRPFPPQNCPLAWGISTSI